MTEQLKHTQRKNKQSWTNLCQSLSTLIKWTQLPQFTDSMDVSLSKLRELGMDREAWHAAVHGSQTVGHDWATELNWPKLRVVSHTFQLLLTAKFLNLNHCIRLVCNDVEQLELSYTSGDKVKWYSYFGKEFGSF